MSSCGQQHAYKHYLTKAPGTLAVYGEYLVRALDLSHVDGFVRMEWGGPHNGEFFFFSRWLDAEVDAGRFAAHKDRVAAVTDETLVLESVRLDAD